jgi:hypothetical protein
MALGEGSGITGMNAMLFSWLQQPRQGNRTGIIPYDFFNTPPGLVNATIGLAVTNASYATPNSTSSGSQSPKSANSSLSLAAIHANIFALFLFTIVITSV